MLESELHDRESDDNTTGGRGAAELTPAVPAAVFQPPQVVFQPPPVRPDPVSPPAHARTETASPPASSEPAGHAEGGGDDDDTAGAGRRRRRRSGRGRGRNGEQDAAAEAGDGTPEAQDGELGQEPAADAASHGGQGDNKRPSSRNRSRRTARSGAVGDGAETPAEAPAAEAQADAGGDGDAGEPGDAEGEASGGSGRRRRRKRRRGSAGDGPDSASSDDPPDTVVHVREPNGGPDPKTGTAGSGSSDVRSVKGSTRLEAKKQRRREGRETGRRRPPVITESEFLARRESVERSMVVRQRKDRTQIAVLEDGVLVEHYVNRSSHQSYVGNVYLGKVQNVLPSMEAAFVDVGKGRNAVLYAGEVNFDVSGLEGQPKRIESALKPGQSLIVQVTKDPVGHKGARLTSQVSLPGRYLVYVPGASMTGISRKLPDTERNRLKQILKKVMPENAGVIVRTAAEGAAEEELSRDVARLAAQWEAIEKKAKTASAPALLYGEPDLTIRVIRDVFNEDFGKLVVSGDEAWDVVDEYVRYVAPHLAERLTRWPGERDVFAEYRIDEQLAKALERKVWLPSGGSLVIDKTEAMTVVDVNTGKFTGHGGNLEETVTRNNLEAAEEIVRQLRLRDVGGIVVIDFIDMVLESNRELVLRRLLECLARDRTKHQVAEVTSLGLVQMTRKRVGAGLLEAFSTPCECCNGRGVILTFDPDSDGQTTQHVHPRGHGGNGGHGNGNQGNGGRGPSPASVAARARPAEIPPAASTPAAAASAPADTASAPAGTATAPADPAPADTAPAPADTATATADPATATTAPAPADGTAPAPADGTGPASADAADGLAAASAASGQPDAAQPDAAQPDAAQVANGQVPGAQPEPARSGGRRRRRRPASAAASAAPASPEIAATAVSATPETSAAPMASEGAAASDTTEEPAAPMTTINPGMSATEATRAANTPATQDGAA
jgi:ribonuclease E